MPFHPLSAAASLFTAFVSQSVSLPPSLPLSLSPSLPLSLSPSLPLSLSPSLPLSSRLLRLSLRFGQASPPPPLGWIRDQSIQSVWNLSVELWSGCPTCVSDYMLLPWAWIILVQLSVKTLVCLILMLRITGTDYLKLGFFFPFYIWLWGEPEFLHRTKAGLKLLKRFF